jgi:hypothetical protein
MEEAFSDIAIFLQTLIFPLNCRTPSRRTDFATHILSIHGDSGYIAGTHKFVGYGYVSCQVLWPIKSVFGSEMEVAILLLWGALLHYLYEVYFLRPQPDENRMFLDISRNTDS